jgi:hypothetical protein
VREKPRCSGANGFNSDSTFPVINVLQYAHRHERRSFSQTRGPVILLAAPSWPEPTRPDSGSPLEASLIEEGYTNQHFNAYAMLQYTAFSRTSLSRMYADNDLFRGTFRGQAQRVSIVAAWEEQSRLWYLDLL